MWPHLCGLQTSLLYFVSSFFNTSSQHLSSVGIGRRLGSFKSVNQNKYIKINQSIATNAREITRADDVLAPTTSDALKLKVFTTNRRNFVIILHDTVLSIKHRDFMHLHQVHKCIVNG